MITFTEEIFNGKLHISCTDIKSELFSDLPLLVATIASKIVNWPVQSYYEHFSLFFDFSSTTSESIFYIHSVFIKYF